ncbi:MAG TPA: DUF87 domain-containing protein [Patescibacteria group bacterium]|nr:DUF87 domain-containing protein [Patescibacteria group bacterium]
MLTMLASVATFREVFGNTPTEIFVNATLPIVFAYFMYRWALQPLGRIVRGMINFWRLRKVKTAFLEITPPGRSEKSPLATQQLITILRQLISDQGIVSLEMLGTHGEGIRYLTRVPRDDIGSLQRQVASYLPEARFRVLESDMPLPDTNIGKAFTWVHEIKQARGAAYPLQAHDDLSQSDLVTFIAGSMTKLKPGEAVALQIVLAPHNARWTTRLYNKILNKGYAVIDHKLRYFLRRYWPVWVVTALIGYYSHDLKMALSWMLFLLLAYWIFLTFKVEEPTITPAEQELFASVLGKLGQPLFRTDIRVMLATGKSERLNELSLGITSSLATLSTPFQGLQVSQTYPKQLGQKIGFRKFHHRLPSFWIPSSNVLSASELASLYHFPYGTITTEGMVRSHGRTLAAPLAIKNGEFDVVLGHNNHHGTTNVIGLTAKERERHTYIIGGTGNGKTTMLQYAIVQDIKNGKGVAVVDPHGDLAETILRHIPKDRIKDVVYFNPSDVGHPIGLNLLELPSNLSGDDLLLAQDFATEAVVSIFRKIFSDDDSGGHRIEFILRNAIHTAFTVEGATLFTVQKLLTNADYRKPIVAKLKDEDLKDFWQNEFGKAGNYQKVKMISGVTAKISRFQRSVAARRILGQVKSTVDFDDILNGKILICNLSKGLVGEDTSEMFGIGILAKLQLAAYRRIHVKEADRKPFYLYVDEFQNFASPLFMQMLSESRKYKMFLTMAEQSTSQQEERQMVETILANVGTLIAFRSGNPADEKFLLPLFKPYISEGEVANLASFNFYMRIMGIKPQEPFSGETIVLANGGSETIAQSVIAASRTNYAKKHEVQHHEKPKTAKPTTGQKTKSSGKPSD